MLKSVSASKIQYWSSYTTLCLLTGTKLLKKLNYFTHQGEFRSSRKKTYYLFLTVRSLSLPKLNCTGESI